MKRNDSAWKYLLGLGTQLSRRLSERFVEIKPIEQCFPDIQKIPHPIHPESVDTAEILGIPIQNSALHFKNEVYHTPSFFSAILEDVLYSPDNGIVVTRDRVVIAESINSVRLRSMFNWAALHFVRVESIRGHCTALRSVSNNFYHVIIDNLPRLYALHFEPYTAIKEIKLLVQGRLTDVEQFFLDRLLPSNVKVTYIRKYRLYRPDKFVFLPFLAQQFSGYLPIAYVEFFMKRVAPQRARVKKHRIFVSRRKAPTRRVINEQDLFEALKRLGFESHVLEELSQEKQIELFYDAEAVVAAHGAGLSNIIYSEAIDVFELFPRDRVKPSYYLLGKSQGHRYHYLCVAQKKATISDDFTVDVDAVVNLVERAVLKADQAR